ncbi:MAG: NEW3 domain-containing protein [bacterium]
MKSRLQSSGFSKRFSSHLALRTTHILMIVLLLAASLCLLPLTSESKPPDAMRLPSNAPISKETRLKLLTLEEAKVSLRTSEDLYNKYEKELEDMNQLYKQDVVTGKEVTDAETKFNDAARRLELARITLAKTALNFLQDATHLSVVSAYQYIDADSNRMMGVTLKNASDASLAKIGLGEGIPEAGIDKKNITDLLTIEDLYVSVRSGATVIGNPYEVRVPALALDESTTIQFKLNADTDEVTLVLDYQNREETRNLYLEKQSGEDIVRVSSLQFAQEGQLGSWVNYDLSLERLAEDEKTFTIEVLNLPERYRYKFMDKSTQLSRVKFSQGVSKRSLVLKVNVPDPLPDAELNKSIPFFAIVGDDDTVETLREQARVKQGEITAAELDAMKVGYERLELTPRGVGKLVVSFTSLYHEIELGDVIEARMKLNNTGSVKLANVHFNTEKPYEWRVTYNPDTVKEIRPRQEKNIAVTIEHPEEAEVGAYEIKVEAETEYEGSTVKTDQKNIRIQLSGKTNLAGTAALIGVLILIVIGIAVFTVKLSRR